jgi:hypothetical protein
MCIIQEILNVLDEVKQSAIIITTYGHNDNIDLKRLEV